MNHLSVLLCVLLAALVPLSYGLYFHIAEGERKCFIEEIPEETQVISELLTVLVLDTSMFYYHITFWTNFLEF